MLETSVISYTEHTDVEHYGNKLSWSCISKEVRGELNLGYTSRGQNLKTNTFLKEPFYHRKSGWDLSSLFLSFVFLTLPHTLASPGLFPQQLHHSLLPQLDISYPNILFLGQLSSLLKKLKLLPPPQSLLPNFPSQILFLEDLSPVNP